MSVLISAAELHAELASSTPPRILDVRWKLGGPHGLPLFEEAHIPGAVFVDLDAELARHGRADEGRHPLPASSDLQDAARRWGINDGDAVVVYDDLRGLSAARAWWLLKHAGVSDVRLLDGALSAWKDAGFALESGAATPPRGTVTLSYGHMPVLDIDDAAALPSAGVLIDARAAERYRGDVEPVDPHAGHIPGAINAPATENTDQAGFFHSPGELAARYAALGATTDTTVGVYCGSGVTAASDVLALAIAGVDAALFPGSWSQWSNTVGREVATGSDTRDVHGAEGSTDTR